MTQLTCLEICAGAGGQVLGLEQAGFEPQALVEIDGHCCNTLQEPIHCEVGQSRGARTARSRKDISGQ
jgi:site-specific DNA-cytosine methylase